METYTDPELVVQHICALLSDDDPRNWRIGVGLIKTLGNPLQLGVEFMTTYACTPKVTLEVMDIMVRNYGLPKDSAWTYPEINNTELVLYKRKAAATA